jgi:glycosyltransferase involved in cell wall biosynthesis
VDEKTLSVVIAFSGEYDLIPETLNSLSEASGISEIIISVDASKANYVEAKDFIGSLATSMEIKPIVVECLSPGPSAVRNLAIQHSSHEIVLPIDSDDLIHPNYPKLICEVYNSGYSNVGIVYGQAELFGKAKGKWNLPPYDIRNMVLENCIYASSGFLKADWRQVGGYDESLIFGQEDWDLWLKILSLGRNVHFLNQGTCFYYRIRTGSRSEIFTKMSEEVIWTYDKVYQNNRQFISNYVEVFTHRRVVLELENASFRKAGEALGKATLKKFRLLRMLWMVKRSPKGKAS